MGNKATIILILIKTAKWVWSVLSGGFLLIILTGFFVDMAHGFSQAENKFFLEMAQWSLTLFGFTLIGAIFEGNKGNGNGIVKRIFASNLFFMASFLGFLYLHAASRIETITGNVAGYLTQIFLVTAFIMAFAGLILGIHILADTLLNHFADLIQNDRTNK